MDKITRYGAHALSYIVSALTVVAGTNPALLPPGWLPYVGLAGVILTGVHGQATGVAPVAKDTLAAAKAVMVLMTCLLVTAVMSTALTACATAPTATEQSATGVAVNIIAGRAIQREDADPGVWKARAAGYKAAAVRLQTVNAGGTATVATLVAELQPLIAKLGPADQNAARILVAALTPYIQEQANANPAVAQTSERLSYILATFIAACEAYGA